MDIEKQLIKVNDIEEHVNNIKQHYVWVEFEPLVMIEEFVDVLSKTAVMASEIDDKIVRQKVLEVSATVRVIIRLLLRVYKQDKTEDEDIHELMSKKFKNLQNAIGILRKKIEFAA